VSTVPLATGTLEWSYCSTDTTAPTDIQVLFGTVSGTYTCTSSLAATCGVGSVRNVFPRSGTFYGVAIATDGTQYWACTTEQAFTLTGRTWSVR